MMEVEFNDLTLEQIDLLETMGVYRLLGKTGVDNLNDMMEKNSIDIASISQHLDEDYNLLVSVRDYLSSTSSKLEQFFNSGLTDEIHDDEVLVRVYFKDKASIEKLEDFKSYGNSWYQIGRGVAMATDTAPDDIRIVGAEKGSVIIDIVAVASIAGILSKIVLYVLEVIQRVLDIQKTKLEIDNLELENKNISLDLDKEIENVQKEGADKILNSVCKEIGIKKDDGGKRNALKKSIELLLSFTQDGGKLDFVHNEVEEDDEEQSSEQKALRDSIDQLDANASKIRELEDKIKLLTESTNKDQ